MASRAPPRLKPSLGRATALVAGAAALVALPVMVLSDANKYVLHHFRPQLLAMKVSSYDH